MGVQYREELRRHSDAHVAMRRALRHTGPVIVASGLTVIAAMGCLSVAHLDTTASLGPIAAAGIAVLLVVMLTLLPALLLLDVDQRAWWPSALSRRPPTKPRWAQFAQQTPRQPEQA